jgi:hypothetical protein
MTPDGLPEVTMVQQFDRAFDVIAWLSGVRYISRLPMAGFWVHVRAWRDNGRLNLSMPAGVRGFAIASLHLEKVGNMAADDVIFNRNFAANFPDGGRPAFDEEFEPPGNA